MSSSTAALPLSFSLGLNQAGSEFACSFRVTHTDCDMHGYMLPSAIMRMCQQIATDHCTALGMDASFYERTHTAYLLAKAAFVWQRIPQVGETLVLRTRPETLTRGAFKRINEVYDASGAEIGTCDSRWVLVDSQTWHILRKLPESYANVPFPPKVDKQLDVNLPRGVQTQPVCSMTATYSYCDANHHVNNTRYADIMCDALPTSALAQSVVNAWTIHYRSEIPYGATFELSRAQLGEVSWFVEGTQAQEQDGKQHFVCSFTTQDIADL